MTTQNKIKIVLPNFREYQTRTDLKSMAWFRVESSISEHPAFFKMDSDGKWFFIFLLSQCAKRNTDCLETDLNYLEHYSGVKSAKINQILPILHESVLIRYEPVTEPLRTRVLHNITNIHTEQYSNNFYELWELYLHRGSKPKANKAYLMAIKQVDHEVIKRALQLYIQSTPEIKYRKHLERWLEGQMWESYITIKPQEKEGITL